MMLLSKTGYLAGRQCAKRLWLRQLAPELGGEPDAGLVARLDAGAEIGRRAHALFPGGVLVDEEAWQHGEAVERTRALLADPGVPSIFEAAFVHAGVRVRVDVLERLAGGTWGVREVKSSARVKDVHLHDVAVQRFVLEGTGLRVASVEVIHVDATYVRGADIDWRRLFHRADVTAAVEPLLRDVAARVESLHRVLARDECPAIEPSPHCFTPYACEFWQHCTREKPDDWVWHLPGGARCFAALRAAGIERISDIPDDFPLSERHARVREVHRSGVDYVSPDLAGVIATLGPPAAYLDFETMHPAVPLHPGTRPYQQIPFQWSLHRVDAAGAIEHLEFLADGRVDPRREFAETLLSATGDRDEPILVYSSFEAGVLDDLAGQLREHAVAIGRVRKRLVDLLPIVRRHVYHAAFGRSLSVKAVAPALVPGFGYADVGPIADGTAASAAFLALARGSVENEAAVRTALRAYCKDDTLALVAVHRALRERAS